MKKRKESRRENVDTLMLNLSIKFESDFNRYKGVSCPPSRGTMHSHIRAIRSHEMPGCFNVDPYLYKWERQKADLLKRYRFSSDVYTTKELNVMTWNKFVATQERLGHSQFKPSSEVIHQVLQKARSLIKGVLGRYDKEAHMARCRFGKKACVGTTATNAYIDSKLENLTGTRQHIKWFTRDYLATDPLLAEIIAGIHCKDGKGYEICDTLFYTQVPKSWKILRGIMPNTTIGSFYTFGLGKMIEESLKTIGIDLSKQQERHKRWARKSSRTRRSFTLDLVGASDSFLSWLLNAVLPRDWFNAVKLGRAPYLSYDGKKYLMQSFMGMGIGFTFPLQTLVYWALVTAVQSLLGHRPGLISVFGDDILAPTAIYTPVVYVLQRLGFVINTDKTYSDLFFRESCGGDYYRGVDVRPFSPEGEGQRVGSVAYLAVCYKLINGFRQRWHDAEIPLVIGYLYAEIMRIAGTIHQVPNHYPDYSGVRVDKPKSQGRILRWSRVGFTSKTYALTFKCLAQQRDFRFVENMQVYLWDKLRSASQGNTQDTEDESYKDNFWCTSLVRTLGPSMFKWLSYKQKNGKIARHRNQAQHYVKRLRAAVPLKGIVSTSYCVKEHTESVWSGAVTVR